MKIKLDFDSESTANKFVERFGNLAWFYTCNIKNIEKTVIITPKRGKRLSVLEADLTAKLMGLAFDAGVKYGEENL